MGRSKPFPDLKVGALRDYLPALSYAIRAVRERERALVQRFEIVGADEAEEVREELEELARTLEAGDASAPTAYKRP